MGSTFRYAVRNDPHGEKERGLIKGYGISGGIRRLTDPVAGAAVSGYPVGTAKMHFYLKIPGSCSNFLCIPCITVTVLPDLIDKSETFL